MAYDNVQIASDPQIKGKTPTEEAHTYTEDEKKEKDLVDDMLEARESYAKSRLSKEKEWTDSYKMYMSFIDTTRNPFLSNLFIPKTHEAVESLAAFFIGTNQSISAEPENNGDSAKAQVAGKWLEFLWRKILKARLKVLTWIKQGEVFGNGVIKLGHDENGVPWIHNTAIEDVYFDYYEPYIQDSEWIFHEVRLLKDDVEKDTKYDAKNPDGSLVRNQVVEGGESPYQQSISYRFSSYDKSLIGDICDGKIVVCEGWCKEENRLISIAPTSQGWRVLRNVVNPYAYKDGEKKVPFRPFVKLRFKTSPLANRAYDTGAVYPTVKIQKAFNDLINQYFDNVVLLNNAMWVKRRGARINPSELIRRPGGVITVGDITADLRAEVTPDIKQSLVEMLNRLDSEFQQASMVVNLLKGVDNGKADTATEVQLGQQNVQTLLDMVDENVQDAMSELGDMLLSISLDNAEGLKTIKMFENDDSIGLLEFDPKDINGRYDIKIVPDRSVGTSKIIRQKQLLDFIKIISADPILSQKFPLLTQKALEKWLEEAGFSDIEYFFEAPQQPQATPMNGQPPAQFNGVTPQAPQIPQAAPSQAPQPLT